MKNIWIILITLPCFFPDSLIAGQNNFYFQTITDNTIHRFNLKKYRFYQDNYRSYFCLISSSFAFDGLNPTGNHKKCPAAWIWKKNLSAIYTAFFMITGVFYSLWKQHGNMHLYENQNNSDPEISYRSHMQARPPSTHYLCIVLVMVNIKVYFYSEKPLWIFYVTENFGSRLRRQSQILPNGSWRLIRFSKLNSL